MPPVRELAAVAAGGCLGAVLRLIVNDWAVRAVPKHPAAGTLAVNVLGCLAIGAAMVWLEPRDARHPSRLLLVTGLLGSLTTFSTFGHQTVELARAGSSKLAVANVAANVVLGFAAVVVGMAIARWAR